MSEYSDYMEYAGDHLTPDYDTPGVVCPTCGTEAPDLEIIDGEFCENCA